MVVTSLLIIFFTHWVELLVKHIVLVLIHQLHVELPYLEELDALSLQLTVAPRHILCQVNCAVVSN